MWTNQIGGVTWQIGDDTTREFVKAGPPHAEFDPAADAARLRWVRRFVPAPEVLGAGRSAGWAWLHTRGLPGRCAVDPVHTQRPADVVPVLGRALRAFHDAVPLAQCPFTWSVQHRLARFVPPARHAEFLRNMPELDEVVCTGDACNPNVLIADDLTFTGYVDLGQLGRADRYADLACALRSLGWNFGAGHEERFMYAYGMALDARKLAFYEALWDAEGDTAAPCAVSAPC